MLVNWSIEDVEDAAEVCLECRLSSASSWSGSSEGGWHQVTPGVRCRLRGTTRRLIELSAELGLPELTAATLQAWRRRLFAWDPAAAAAIGEAGLERHLGLRTDAPAMSEAAFLRRCLERDEEDRRVRSGRLARASSSAAGRFACGSTGRSGAGQHLRARIPAGRSEGSVDGLGTLQHDAGERVSGTRSHGRV